MNQWINCRKAKPTQGVPVWIREQAEDEPTPTIYLAFYWGQGRRGVWCPLFDQTLVFTHNKWAEVKLRPDYNLRPSHWMPLPDFREATA
jgi:hypothetical protein